MAKHVGYCNGLQNISLLPSRSVQFAIGYPLGILKWPFVSSWYACSGSLQHTLHQYELIKECFLFFWRIAQQINHCAG